MMPATHEYQDIYASSPGIVFGDDHSDPAIICYIASQMQSLKKAGVSVVFLEVFKDTPEQRQWLEQFNRGQDSAHMITGWLDKVRTYYPERAQDYLSLLTAARANGIELIGIEPDTRDILHPISSANAAWIRTIKSYLSVYPGARYAVFCGKLHTEASNQLATESECDQAEGIDKSLGIPCLTFTTLPSQAPRSQVQIHAQDKGNYSVMLTQTSPGRPVPSR